MTIEVEDPEVAGALRYLSNGALQDVSVADDVTFTVLGGGDGYEIFEDGALVGRSEGGPGGVLEFLYLRVHSRAFALASAGGWVRMHAAVVDGPWGRAAIVAPSGSGKTTLACRLLFDGDTVRADESVLVRAGSSLPVPRPFHLKVGIDSVVPELTALLPDLPRSPSGATWAFDPARGGFPWEITGARIDHVVVLGRDAEGDSLRPLRSIDAAPTVVRESFPFSEPTSQRIRELALVARQARCWELRSASVERSASLIRTLGRC